MSVKNSIVFSLEMKHSNIAWGCENSSEGEDLYKDTILPYNVGDNVTREDKCYIVDSKDWDYDNNTVWFVMILKK